MKDLAINGTGRQATFIYTPPSQPPWSMTVSDSRNVGPKNAFGVSCSNSGSGQIYQLRLWLRLRLRLRVKCPSGSNAGPGSKENGFYFIGVGDICTALALLHNLGTGKNPCSSADTGRWSGTLPRPSINAPHYALAAWVSESGRLMPLQSTGGLMPEGYKSKVP